MYFTSSRFQPTTKPKRNHPIKASAGKMAKNQGMMKSKRMNTTFGITEKRISVKSTLTDVR